VVFGGPYPSSDPELALGDPCVDAAVTGEGEETFNELVRVIAGEGPRWREPGTLGAVAGLAFMQEGAVRRTGARAPIEDLDSLPTPAWDLIDYRRYWRRGGMASVGKRPYLTMFTSRGCPYRCVFCHNIFGKTFRARSPESVAGEAAELMRLGAGDIEILDDIANYRQERFDRMLELMLERGLHPALSFPNGVRADLLSESSVDLLKKVGTGEISVAVETASPRLQKLLRKNISLDKVSRAIDMMAARRIFTRGFFMLGLPTETEQEIRATARFARQSRLHLALFFTPNPYPGTELYTMFAEAGKLPAAARPGDYDYFGSAFNGSQVTAALYRRLYRQAYYGFYLNPLRAMRIARDRPRWSDIPARAYGLFRNMASFRRLEGN